MNLQANAQETMESKREFKEHNKEGRGEETETDRGWQVRTFDRYTGRG